MDNAIVVQATDSDEMYCLNPGCAELVTMGRTGPTTQCQTHLDQHRKRNTKYKQKKHEELSLLKKKEAMFDKLFKHHEQLKQTHERLRRDYERVTTKHVR